MTKEENLLNTEICDRILDEISDIFEKENLSIHEVDIILAMLVKQQSWDERNMLKKVDKKKPKKKKK